jgi:hypothetical protein
VTFDWVLVVELTAAGQLRIYTVFPFNLWRNVLPLRTKSAAKITLKSTVKTDNEKVIENNKGR